MIARVFRAGGALALLAFPLLVPPAFAQDVAAGRKLVAGVCQSCHGINGIATNPDAANLAGQDAGYLSRQLHAFKSGDRKNEQMSAVVEMLNDQQIEDVSAYFSAIKVKVEAVPAAN